MHTVVKDSWVGVNYHLVARKLVDCASDFDRCNRSRIRKNSEDKDRLLGILERCRGCTDPATVGQYMEAHLEYNIVLIREDTYWRQRAKTYWLREGDLNTQFFHWSATSQKNF